MQYLFIAVELKSLVPFPQLIHGSLLQRVKKLPLSDGQAAHCEEAFINVLDAALEQMLQADGRSGDEKQTSCGTRTAFAQAVCPQYM